VKSVKNALICLPFLLVTGCTNLGPQAIQGSRTDYNIALRQTEDEQLLLNLVRLRYRDRVLFLQLSTLTTQFTFAASGNISSEFGDTPSLYGINGRVAIEEKPTVTYTPLQGGDYVEQVLSPIKLETLFLLNGSGWSSERLFRTLIEQLNGVENAPGASGPTPDHVPEYEKFLHVTQLLRRLEVAGLVTGAGSESGMVLQFESAAQQVPDYQNLMEMLGLDPTIGVYPITTGIGRQEANSLNVRFRSFAGVMYFLSQAIDIPAKDVSAGRVTVTRDDSGRSFDWAQVTAGLMYIKSSEDRPKNASVAVFYRGSWFYIDDSDLNSKSTFSMLGQVFALQSGDVEPAALLLTLPVGG
jgi:hypothetical protein